MVDCSTLVAMSIDERRAKRKTTTIPGVLPGEGGRLMTEAGTEASDHMIGSDEEEDE